MLDVSFVIPALNEQDNIPRVLGTIPGRELTTAFLTYEVIVVDNDSTDDTARVAAEAGARVVSQPSRGYGNAYFAGFEAAQGHLIITGDADCTYPFDHALRFIDKLHADNLDFLSTNRLGRRNRAAMKWSHLQANRVLSTVSRGLFRTPFHDSQSGMWIFRREVWMAVDVRSTGMAFSQELKHEAYLCGFRCGETAIEYRPRRGEVKLHALPDGLQNLAQLGRHRLRRKGAGQNLTPVPCRGQLLSQPPYRDLGTGDAA